MVWCGGGNLVVGIVFEGKGGVVMKGWVYVCLLGCGYDGYIFAVYTLLPGCGLCIVYRISERRWKIITGTCIRQSNKCSPGSRHLWLNILLDIYYHLKTSISISRKFLR